MKSWVALAALIVLGSVSARSADPAGSGKLYPVRGAMLYVRSIGHGRPILFLHGGMQFFDNAFAKQRDFFAADHRVIGIDQRGSALDLSTWWGTAMVATWACCWRATTPNWFVDWSYPERVCDRV
jgi:pimeloyl-ACP methyl ester carboxylesterase